MKCSRTTLAIAAALALMTTIGIRADSAGAPAAPQTAPAQPVSEVARLYRLHCQLCHGAHGKAPIPEMAFVGRAWKHGTSSTQVAKVITEGVKGTAMMPFKSKLKPEQILALAKHVRAFDPTLKPKK